MHLRIPTLVFHHIHPMVGMDFENSIIPPAPATIPLVPYMSVTLLSGNFFTPNHTSKTFALFTSVSIMQKGTDCGYFGVPHFGNPANTLYPLILAMCKSKSHFGVASVKMEGKAVATAALCIVGQNLNCGTISTLTGLVLPPTTVVAGMTIGDMLAGHANIVADMCWDLITKKILGLGPISKFNKWLTDKIIGKLLRNAFESILKGSGDIAAKLVGKQIEKLMKKYILELGIGYAVKEATGTDKPTSATKASETAIRSNHTWNKYMEADDTDSF